jgi:hypothetical protein
MLRQAPGEINRNRAHEPPAGGNRPIHRPDEPALSLLRLLMGKRPLSPE